MRHNHGDWHIALQNIQDNEAEQIRKDNDVAFSSWYDSINANAEQDYYIGGKNAVIYGIEEACPGKAYKKHGNNSNHK